LQLENHKVFIRHELISLRRKIH